MKRKVLLGALTAALGGGGALYAFDTLADQSVTVRDADVSLGQMWMGERAVEGGVVYDCEAQCRLHSIRVFDVREHGAVSAAACYSALVADCTAEAVAVVLAPDGGQ